MNNTNLTDLQLIIDLIKNNEKPAAIYSFIFYKLSKYNDFIDTKTEIITEDLIFKICSNEEFDIRSYISLARRLCNSDSHAAFLKAPTGFEPCENQILDPFKTLENVGLDPSKKHIYSRVNNFFKRLFAYSNSWIFII
jgi:hypothetical protein